MNSSWRSSSFSQLVNKSHEIPTYMFLKCALFETDEFSLHFTHLLKIRYNIFLPSIAEFGEESLPFGFFHQEINTNCPNLWTRNANIVLLWLSIKSLLQIVLGRVTFWSLQTGNNLTLKFVGSFVTRRLARITLLT